MPHTIWFRGSVWPPKGLIPCTAIGLVGVLRCGYPAAGQIRDWSSWCCHHPGSSASPRWVAEHAAGWRRGWPQSPPQCRLPFCVRGSLAPGDLRAGWDWNVFAQMGGRLCVGASILFLLCRDVELSITKYITQWKLLSFSNYLSDCLSCHFI